MSEKTCEEFRQLSAELALGVADARDRAAAATHLDRCAACRFELRQLSDVADGLSALTPAVEPPAGFESRLLARLRSFNRDGPTARRPAARLRSVWVGVAAAAALVFGAVGWAIGSGSTPAPAPAAGHVVMAKLTSDRHAVGQVVLETRGDPWISMAVSIGNADTRVQCQLRTSRGGVITVGWFALSHGYGYWAAPLASATGTSVEAVQVADAQGRVLARAALPPVELVAARTS